MNRRWIPAIVFWVLFLASFAVAEHYPEIDTFWVAARILLLLMLVGYGIVRLFRTPLDKSAYVGYRGMLIPRWMVTLFGGDGEEVAPKPPKSQNSTPITVRALGNRRLS